MLLTREEISMDKYYHLQLRNWRKGITGKVKYVRTLQFPVSLDENIKDFTPFESLYNVLNGCKKGTINGLICALHLCGFRFFSSGKDAVEGFIKQQTNDTVSFKALYPLGFKNSFQPSTLSNVITKERRRTNNIINDDTIAKEKKKFTGEFLEKKASDTAKAILDTWWVFIKENYEEFKQFQTNKPNLEKVFNAFVDSCRKNGVILPENIYQTLLAKKEKIGLPQDSTIIFDPSRVSGFNLRDLQNSDYLAHITVAHLNNIDGNINGLLPGTSFSSLSWLLGNGLKYWQTKDEHTICTDYAVPPQYAPCITEIKTWFLGLDTQKNIFTGNFADYRTSVGGALQAWSTNYFKRLELLSEKQSLAIEIPTELSNQPQEVKNRYPYSLDEIAENISRLDHSAYERALSGVLGNNPADLQEDNFKTITDSIYSYNDIIGKIEADINIINQIYEKEIKKNKKIEKLNRLTGGTPNAQAELASALEKFNTLQKEIYAFADDILAQYTDTTTDILSILAEKERQKITDAAKENKNSPQEQAKRLLLQKLFSLAKNEPVLLDIVYNYFGEKGIFSKHILNRLLINKTGSVYKAPRSTKNDDAAVVNRDVLAKSDVLQMLQDIYKQSQALTGKHALRACLAVKHLYYSVLLNGIEDNINIDWSKYPFLQEIPMPRYMLAKGKSVKKEDVISILNYGKSYLTSFLFILLRENFIIRTNFSIVGNCRLFYAPKVVFKDNKNTWQLPRLYRTGKFSRIVANWPNVLDSAQLKKYVAQLTLKDNTEREFLIQLPHDLYIDLGLKGKTKKFGFPFGKGNITHLWEDTAGTYGKLVGPSHYKNILDRTLLQPVFGNKLQVSEYTLLFEQEYTQHIDWDGKTIAKVEITPKEGVSCRVHIPISEEETREQTLMNETVIGIDLGEAGIGYAVFPVAEIEKSILQDYTPKPSAYGSKAIGSIKKLMRKVKKYRKNLQRRQKFQKQYSDAQAKFRANVAGDIAHHIDALCRKYKGFPVLEASVRNLSGGAKQLMSVYDKVLNMYCFSEADAHKKERKAHWMQVNDSKAVQEHPVFKQDDDKSGRPVPLKLFLGQSIGAAATSQCCSKCGRNPLLSFEEKYGRNATTKNITIGPDSSVEVANGVLLLRKENVATRKQNRVKKRAVAFDECIPVGSTISAAEGYKILKKQLRQRPLDLRSKDTTQSQYYCPYADCGKAHFTMHADANAAVNIVRKWAAKKLHAHIPVFWREKEELTTKDNMK